MTTSDNPSSFRYEGNGSTDTFAFPARIFGAGDLIVEIITRATDVLEETLTITTDYTVTINGDESASVTTVAGKIPSTLQDIQIRRALDKTQTTDLPTGTVFPAVSVENSLDRLTAIVQELSDSVDRAVTLSVTSSLSTVELPNPAASEIIGWNATADALTSYAQADFIGPTGPQGPVGSIENIEEQPTGTPAIGDWIVWADISDSDNSKKASIANVVSTTGVINAATSGTIAPSDEVLFGDVDDSNNVKKDTVQGILDLVTVNNGDWSGADLAVDNGGTGRSSHTAYAVLCGGTTTTGAQQSVAGVGSNGQVLTSNGAGALPTFQDSSGEIGADQSWNNVLGSRSSGVQYTNSTGKSIFVAVQVGTSSSFSAYDIEIDGNLVGDLQQQSANTFYARTEFFIVPDGDTYEITVTTGNIEAWWELR